MHINSQYERILNPVELVKEFETMYDFRIWCYDGTVEDLDVSIKAFESYELYEHCAIMLSVRNNKLLYNEQRNKTKTKRENKKSL